MGDVPTNDSDKAVTNGGSTNSSQCSQDTIPSIENSQNSESLSDMQYDDNLLGANGDICKQLNHTGTASPETEISKNRNGGCEMNGNKVEQNGNVENQNCNVEKRKQNTIYPRKMAILWELRSLENLNQCW